MNWQRATTPTMRNQRKESIYDAAFKLFRQKSYDTVSFNAIAAEAGCAKSNIYRYYNSKEEIFLNIFSDLFAEWSTDCLHKLRNLQQGASESEFAEAWVKAIIPHKAFLNLLPFLFISLERNSSYNQLLEFKQLTKLILTSHAKEMKRIMPDISEQFMLNFLMLANGAVSSIWAASGYNQIVDKIYNLNDFAELRPDFERDLVAAIEILIHGIKQKQNEMKQ